MSRKFISVLTGSKYIVIKDERMPKTVNKRAMMALYRLSIKDLSDKDK